MCRRLSEKDDSNMAVYANSRLCKGSEVESLGCFIAHGSSFQLIITTDED